ncbi:MAG: multifunctional CCA tRNA nucleotidyl transferase/2'3'-cyclic phosphodiesterase/2'nucleotidase/phosphatase [Gammaproteobacteria bacterium]|nr:multifunctional CCA tRNA nucleotidyl transferase/2'3'-cyclic phosphodiesterase/2'nucleotidase/phosphatase [Gammaproteobacteria bacterium]
MQIFLVGGAVRDELLGIEPVERDWVVVGGTPEALLEQGFVQIDSRFPVFVHPDSGDEYALARRETKIGSGHKGFLVDSGPDVTLLEDLARRDLRINAIARAENGDLIDPYDGLEDLHHRQLRHITPAFAEDPLRVLRLARFAAILAHLNFEVATSTMDLARYMVGLPEFAELSGDRAWRECIKVLRSPSPSRYFELLGALGALHVLLPGVDWAKARFPIPAPDADQQEHLGHDPLLDLLASSFARQKLELGRLVTVMLQRWPIPREGRETLNTYIALLDELGSLEHADRALELCQRLDGWRRRDRLRMLLHLVCRHEDHMRANTAARFLRAHDAGITVRSEPFLQAGLTGKPLGRAMEMEREARFKSVWETGQTRTVTAHTTRFSRE